MFIRNAWYAAAWPEEVGRTLLSRRVLDEPVLFWRTSSGRIAAVADRCSHRRVPLSLGRLVGDTVECGYHGLRFDPAGRCVHIPGQGDIPAEACISAYPAVERWKTVWLWMGEPSRADESLIPDLWWLDDARWTGANGYVHLDANYQLLVDNLLDLSHVSFVHRETLAGSPEEAAIPLTTESDGATVRVGRWMLGLDPPPMFAAARGGFPGKVDRWQHVTWRPPATVVLDVGCAEAGTGAMQGDRSRGISMWSNHLITPETPTSTHYFWCYARNYALDDASVTAVLRDGGYKTFREDAAMIEAQQRVLDSGRGGPAVDIRIDEAPLLARRITAEILAGERAGGSGTRRARA